MPSAKSILPPEWWGRPKALPRIRSPVRTEMILYVPAPGVSAPAVGLQYISASVLAALTRACVMLVALPVAAGETNTASVVFSPVTVNVCSAHTIVATEAGVIVWLYQRTSCAICNGTPLTAAYVNPAAITNTTKKSPTAFICIMVPSLIDHIRETTGQGRPGWNGPARDHTLQHDAVPRIEQDIGIGADPVGAGPHLFQRRGGNVEAVRNRVRRRTHGRPC